MTEKAPNYLINLIPKCDPTIKSRNNSIPTKLSTRPQLQTCLCPIYLSELFVTGVIFNPKFTTLQRYT